MEEGHQNLVTSMEEDDEGGLPGTDTLLADTVPLPPRLEEILS